MVHFEGHFKGTYGLRAKEDLKIRRGRSMKISSQSIFDQRSARPSGRDGGLAGSEDKRFGTRGAEAPVVA